jgi:hypothetical protein
MDYIVRPMSVGMCCVEAFSALVGVDGKDKQTCVHFGREQ